MDSQLVELDIEELKEAMRTDCVAFLSFYLQDELTLDVPQLHEEIWDEFVNIVNAVNLDDWRGHLQKLFCVPRGHAKSTLTKLAIILFFRYSRISFAVYASLTAGIAKAACRDIVNWLRTDHDQHVFGHTTVIKSNEAEQLWILEIGTPNRGRKTVLLKAIGSDQQVRGTLVDNKRPELLVIDDCEDNRTAASDESQANLDTWLMGNLLKATARRSVRIMLGNMINSRTMLYRFSKDPAWNPTVYGAIIRDKTTGELKALWSGLYTLEELLEDYKNYRSKGVGHVWVYEMMNMTADSIFKIDLSQAVRIPRPNPDEVVAGIITVDPAFGQKSWHDPTGIVVHVKIKERVIPFIVDSRKGRMSEDQMLDTLIELSYYWNISTWGIESVAAQRLLISLFKAKLKERQIPEQLFTMIGLPSGGVAKASRILAMINSIASGNYGVAIEEEELLTEISLYDPDSTDHEDIPDAAAYGVIAWAQAGEQIQEGGFLKEKLQLIQQQVMAESVHQSQYVPY